MIDIHCHILPGLDDGSQSMEESIEMAKIAVLEGIHTIIATPHHANGRYTNEAAIVIEAVNQLNHVLQEKEIPLTITTGQEIRIYDQFIGDWHEQKLLALHQSDYILVEFPSSHIPDYMADMIHELKVMKKIPIIAHPERNREIAEDPSKLEQLIELGALSQVTAHSINGLFGKKIQGISFDLCRRNLVHLIASDAHNVGERSFGLREAYERIADSLGLEYSNEYRRNAYAIFQNNSFSIRKPIAKTRKWFQIWKRL